MKHVEFGETDLTQVSSPLSIFKQALKKRVSSVVNPLAAFNHAIKNKVLM